LCPIPLFGKLFEVMVFLTAESFPSLIIGSKVCTV
jgi:hypothetical protein